MLACVLLLVTVSPAFATWSVIAVDQATQQVVIASATCVAQRSFANFPAKGLMDVQAIVVPGKGVAAAQAGVDRTRANQKLIFAEIDRGTDPKQIIELLQADPSIDTRQFAVVDLQGRMAGFSGQKNNPASLDRQDRVAETGIFFSVQGNILMSDAVVTAAVDAFKNASGSLSDRVMVAMETADAKGGDKRCTCETEPTVNAPCDGKTAHVAYILAANATDRSGASFNDGTYTLYVSATDADITSSENANPVKTLRMRYEVWKKANPG
ncbi:MAG: DUF1028 domain-containing protein [Vicinamibacterales bacterium]